MDNLKRAHELLLHIPRRFPDNERNIEAAQVYAQMAIAERLDALIAVFAGPLEQSAPTGDENGHHDELKATPGE
jgi:hypothetical protein